MTKHLLLAHGVRRGDLNERVKSRIDALMTPYDFEFSTAFLESDTQNARIVIERMIADGAAHIVITPLFMLPASHVQEDIPEIVRSFNASHPEVEIEVRPVLTAHPLVKDIIRQRLAEASAPAKDGTAAVIIAHGNPRFPEADEALESFTESLDLGCDVHAMMLYGELGFEKLLPEISRRYNQMIIVPLFLYDGYMTEKIREMIGGMDLQAPYEMTQSLDFDPLLGQVIKDLSEWEV